MGPMARLLPVLVLAALALATPSLALADVANDPCEGLDEGAACTTLDDEAGTCQTTNNGFLDCVPGGTTAPSSSASTTTGGATTGAATTGGAGGGGGGDDGGAGGGTTGGATEDDGCAVQAPGRKGATRAAAALVFAVGVLATGRRWLRRAVPRA